MVNQLIRNNVTLVAIVLFLIIFGAVQAIKPRFFYNIDGSIRQFGVGYRNKTIIPIWLFSIILGILCYLAVLYYVAYPRFI